VITPTGTSRFVAKGRFGTAGTDAGLGNSGHGQLNMSIVGGFVPTGTVSGVNFAAAPHADASGFRYGLGIAPFVRLANSIIFDPNYTDPAFGTMLSANFAGGTRISSNSWGSAVAGAYNTDSQAYDALVRDARASAALNQQMTIIFAAGNGGAGVSTVGSPGAAKNVITVGASENVHPFGGPDGCNIADSGADSLNDMIPFSSRGPTTDARFKPDIVAPGTHVTGMAFVTPDSSGTGTAVASYRADGVCGGVGSSDCFPSTQRWYTASSGTSHSTPAVAGGAALVYQQFLYNPAYPAYLADQRTPAADAPSPALVKAYLMHTARHLTGTGAGGNLPSNNQGMGLMDLGRSFDSTPRLIRDQVATDRFSASRQNRSFRATISDNSRPVRVTLAWTEPVGTTTGNSFVNNLDVVVLHSGNAYLGNVFTGLGSVTGGAADIRNNVESVFLPAGISGPVTIIVRGTNIAGQADPTVAGVNQDFALVGYNLQASVACTTASSIMQGSVLADGTIGVPHSQALTGSGGPAPYSFQLISGALPPGLSLVGNAISGTPTTKGLFSATLVALDATNCAGVQSVQIGVGPAVVALGARTVTTGNAVLEPNECNSLNVALTNTGNNGARSVVATLSTGTAGVTVAQAQARHPDIPPGGSALNLTPFRVTTGNALVCFTNAGLTLTPSFTGGTPAALNFSLGIGSINDRFSASTSSGNITMTGAALVVGSQVDDAIVSVTVPAGFNFSVYGSTVTGETTLRAGTNRFLLFTPSGGVDGGTSAFNNQTLPTIDLNDTVPAFLPYWDDLDLRVANGGTNAGIYSSALIGSAPNRRWQLIWRGELFGAPTSGESLRVAIEFTEGSEAFRYLYDLTGANNGAAATVGTQQSLSGLFTQHSFDQNIITNNLVLAGTRDCSAGSGICSSSGTTITSVNPAGTQTVGVTLTVNVTVSGTSPTGSVTVDDAQDGVCSFNLPATSCSMISLASGALTLTATYSGNASHPSSSGTAPVTVVANNRGLQVGSVSVPATIAGANALTRVNFARAFNATLVVIVMPSNEDVDPQGVRIRSVTSTGTGFEILQVEAPGCVGCTGNGGSMTVHWLAAIPGSYRLSSSLAAPFNFGPEVRNGPGALVKVGTVALSARQYNSGASFVNWPAAGFSTVNFPSVVGFNFAAAPVLLTGLQSWSPLNEGSDLDTSVSPAVLTGTPEPWATVAVRNLSGAGFEAAIEHSEVNEDDTAALGMEQAETLGYFAIEGGVALNLVTDSGSPVGLATGQGTITDSCAAVDLPLPGTIAPANLRGFAGLHTRNDSDGGWLPRPRSTPTSNSLCWRPRRKSNAQPCVRERQLFRQLRGLIIWSSPRSCLWMTLRRYSACNKAEASVCKC